MKKSNCIHVQLEQSTIFESQKSINLNQSKPESGLLFISGENSGMNHSQFSEIRKVLTQKDDPPINAERFSRIVHRCKKCGSIEVKVDSSFQGQNLRKSNRGQTTSTLIPIFELNSLKIGNIANFQRALDQIKDCKRENQALIEDILKLKKEYLKSSKDLMMIVNGYEKKISSSLASETSLKQRIYEQQNQLKEVHGKRMKQEEEMKRQKEKIRMIYEELKKQRKFMDRVLREQKNKRDQMGLNEINKEAKKKGDALGEGGLIQASYVEREQRFQAQIMKISTRLGRLHRELSQERSFRTEKLNGIKSNSWGIRNQFK